MLSRTEIVDLIRKTVTDSQHNRFHAMGNPGEPMWEEPIVGFARGDDPYFAYYKKTIGDFYWLPREVYFKGTGETVEDGQLTVISIGFPQTEKTKADQKSATGIPSDRWLYTRGEWEAMVRKISDEIVEKFTAGGIQAVSLETIGELQRQVSEDFGIASNWSHRHTAFIAGLGTFGLSDGLITEKGKAMRFTTIIAKAAIEPTERPYSDHHAYCRFYTENKCGACIVRCPVNAITKEGHDKEACNAYLIKIKKEIGPDFVKNSHYTSGCGLCQSRIPCQDRIPG